MSLHPIGRYDESRQELASARRSTDHFNDDWRQAFLRDAAAPARVVVGNFRQPVGAKAVVRTRRDLQGALTEIAMLEEELQTKDARMAVIDPHRRPYYRPIERMAILKLRVPRGWSQAETARRFLVNPTTVPSWLKRVDESGPSPLVQLPAPVNKLPDLVRYVVRRLKMFFPSMGRKRIAPTSTRAGVRLSASTVSRMLENRRSDPQPPTETETTGADKLDDSSCDQDRRWIGTMPYRAAGSHFR